MLWYWYDNINSLNEITLYELYWFLHKLIKVHIFSYIYFIGEAVVGITLWHIPHHQRPLLWQWVLQIFVGSEATSAEAVCRVQAGQCQGIVGLQGRLQCEHPVQGKSRDPHSEFQPVSQVTDMFVNQWGKDDEMQICFYFILLQHVQFCTMWSIGHKL